MILSAKDFAKWVEISKQCSGLVRNNAERNIPELMYISSSSECTDGFGLFSSEVSPGMLVLLFFMRLFYSLRESSGYHLDFSLAHYLKNNFVGIYYIRLQEIVGLIVSKMDYSSKILKFQVNEAWFYLQSQRKDESLETSHYFFDNNLAWVVF
jgi:hypothetical protein